MLFDAYDVLLNYCWRSIKFSNVIENFVSARELHRKLAVLKRVQKDIEERTRILREKNLELLERNQQLSAGNRQLRDELVEVSAVRREREEYLRLAIIHQEVCQTWPST